MRALLAAAVLAGTTGCAYSATLQTNPVGASVFLDNEPAGIAPVPIKVRAFTGPSLIRVELPGYRPYEVELKTERRLWTRFKFGLVNPGVILGSTPPPVRTLVLVPEHGPAGTWTPEDVER